MVVAGSFVAELSMLDQNWRAYAKCAKDDPEIWFGAGAIEHKLAKRVCGTCPVRKECLIYALEAPIDHGVWGGMTERERRRFRRHSQGNWRQMIVSGAALSS